MKKLLLLLPAFFLFLQAKSQSALQKMQGVSFADVTIHDDFWKPKIDKVAVKTLAACIYQTEVATGRLRNFEKVARHKGEKHEGLFYDDSDVYKALEAMAYSLKNHPNPEMEKKADQWIDIIAAAQLPDGYLNTWYTLKGLDQRWTDMSMHEDYNGGHLIEAAVAYYNATGKRKLLDVAIRFADHFMSLFGPGKRHWVTGHEELELALVKLYRVTGEKKYLDESDWLLNERGHGYAKGYTWTDWKDTAYAQDVKPVKEQTEITGHAVRAMYLYTGAADVAAQTGDTGYLRAMKAVWEDVVYRNMYITGGIGSAGSNEGFTVDYDLPNEQAYCETCASVGMVFWNQRMNWLTGESKYIDVLERSLYNGALDGLSLTGDHFFYGNPLASQGQHARREWFGTACCPANIARLVSSLGDYIYAKSEDGIWVNLFVGSSMHTELKQQQVNLDMNTRYPWDGAVQIRVDPEKNKLPFDLHIRIPGWVEGQPVPGKLYYFENPKADQFAVTLDGKPVAYQVEKGYIVINRKWMKGDELKLNFPMDVRRVEARPEVKADQGRVALQRGPLVYCVEGADNDQQAWNFILPNSVSIHTHPEKILDEEVTTLQATVPSVLVNADGLSVSTRPKTITAIPYYTWANRGKNEMQVWLPVSIKEVKLND